MLWPAPAEVLLATARPAASGPEDSAMLVLPGLRGPRLVVPQDRRAGSAAVRRYGEPGSVRTRLATRALSVSLASGLGGLVLRDRLLVRVPAGAQSIESHLSSVLGQRMLVSIHIGAARANRKPVLQLLTPSGQTVGFAKIGVNPLTVDLVRAEHEALDRLNGAGLACLQVPRVLDRSRWHGMDVLVLSPLPVWQKRTPPRAGQLERAMAEVAHVSGVRSLALAGSEYWRRLAARLDDACNGKQRDGRPGDGNPPDDLSIAEGKDARGEQEELRVALARLASLAGTTTLGFGSWHGDFTPWNMACTRGGLLVWDWERFSADAPLGFDALHYWLQAEVVPGRRDPAQAAADCVQRAGDLLKPLGVAPAQARLTALVYLADLSVRYLADRQEQAGARLGAPRRWLLPALMAGISGLPGAG
jgi:hypothetical protein